MNPTRVLQVIMGLIAAAHLIIGGGLNLGGADMVKSVADIYGAQVESWSPQFLYIVKPLGAFMFALGIIGVIAAFNPRKHVAIIYGFAALFILRALQRVTFGQEIIDTFAIDQSRNVGNAIFFAALAVVLVVLVRKATQSASAQSE